MPGVLSTEPRVGRIGSVRGYEDARGEREMDLVTLTEGYLEGQGFQVSRPAKDQLLGSRLTVGEEREFVSIWVLREADPAAIRSREGAYLARFKEAADSHPAAQRILLVESRAGLSREFEIGAQRWYGVRVRTAAQFFDTSFKWEESPETASALLKLKKMGDETKSWRVPQPFGSRSGTEGPDLLPHLSDEVMKPRDTGKPIALVIGPAGMGKSILLAALFAELYDAFQDRKRRDILAARPLVLLPEHIPLGEAPTVRSILRGFLSTEFARPLDQRLFEWRLAHGLTSWLLDGLDEIISLDPGFFDDLLDLLTRPDSTSQVGPMRIVVSVRDTLLATNDPLREFLDECGDVVEVYRLEPWDTQAKRRFAERRAGAQADRLVALVRGSEALDRLSGIPYYYSLLIDAFLAGRLSETTDEVSLLSMAVGSILERDVEKGILDPSLIPQADVVEFAESIAVEDLRNGFRGVPVESARNWAQLILPAGMPPDEQERWLANLTQQALFSYGGLGQIQFAQELVEQYLLGQALLRALDQSLETFLRLLNIRQLPWDWLALRILAEGVKTRERHADLINAATDHVSRPVMFKNLVQVLLLADIRPDDLRMLPLEQRDLAGVVFPSVDLSGASLRGCNLTDARFDRCVLRGTLFAGAILSGTAFEHPVPDSFTGADFGDLSRCHSIRVDDRVLVGVSEVRAWLEQMRAAATVAGAPCPTAQQLRHLFMKFVRPDGSARRSWLDERALQRGRRFSGAADMDELVDAVTRHGYLVLKTERPLVERPGGDRYSEIVQYVKDLTMSEGLRALLDDTCPSPGCTHVG